MTNLTYYMLVFVIGWFIGMLHQDLRIAMNPENMIHKVRSKSGGANPLNAPSEVKPKDIQNPTED